MAGNRHSLRPQLGQWAVGPSQRVVLYRISILFSGLMDSGLSVQHRSSLLAPPPAWTMGRRPFFQHRSQDSTGLHVLACTCLVPDFSKGTPTSLKTLEAVANSFCFQKRLVLGVRVPACAFFDTVSNINRSARSVCFRRRLKRRRRRRRRRRRAMCTLGSMEFEPFCSHFPPWMLRPTSVPSMLLLWTRS